ncbi:MAG: hypothetical protein ACT4NU_00975 [Chromatiales bacterium]
MSRAVCRYALARFLGAGGIVELTAVIGFYNMLNRLNESLQTDFDFRRSSRAWP